jgi:4-hydroxy-tetrahydrodipicolinate reductase
VADQLTVAVIGARGRMGTVTCDAVEAADDLELVARIGSDDLLHDVTDAGASVAVELTTPMSVFDNTAWLLDHGVHVVVGASGLDQRRLEQLAERTDRANCLVVPNFAIGAVLMMRLAEQVAAHLPTVEIIEAHHAGKADAPSGTALRTAACIARARTGDAAVPGPEGNPARGSVHGDVPIHSVRLPGLVASQSVIFGGEGQTLTIRHDSIDRRSFMPGMLLAVRGVADLPGLTVGLDAVL